MSSFAVRPFTPIPRANAGSLAVYVPKDVAQRVLPEGATPDNFDTTLWMFTYDNGNMLTPEQRVWNLSHMPRLNAGLLSAQVPETN